MSRSRVRVLALAIAGVLALGVPATPRTPASAMCPFVPPGGVGCPDGSVAVLGYIAIHHMNSIGLPFTYELIGALGDPNLFSCSAATLAGGEFKVTCKPVPISGVTWRCDVLHADASTFSSSARARVALDCDGQAPAEAQTTTVTGQGGHDTGWAPANVVATEFSCTLDGGTLPPSPDFAVGCGDPGAVTLNGN